MSIKTRIHTIALHEKKSININIINEKEVNMIDHQYVVMSILSCKTCQYQQILRINQQLLNQMCTINIIQNKAIKKDKICTKASASLSSDPV